MTGPSRGLQIASDANGFASTLSRDTPLGWRVMRTDDGWGRSP